MNWTAPTNLTLATIIVFASLASFWLVACGEPSGPSIGRLDDNYCLREFELSENGDTVTLADTVAGAGHLCLEFRDGTEQLRGSGLLAFKRWPGRTPIVVNGDTIPFLSIFARCTYTPDIETCDPKLFDGWYVLEPTAVIEFVEYDQLEFTFRPRRGDQTWLHTALSGFRWSLSHDRNSFFIDVTQGTARFRAAFQKEGTNGINAQITQPEILDDACSSGDSCRRSLLGLLLMGHGRTSRGGTDPGVGKLAERLAR